MKDTFGKLLTARELTFADEAAKNPAWRRVLLATMLLASFAFVVGMVFEELSRQWTPFDRVAYPSGVAWILSLAVLLLAFPRHFKALASALVVGVCAFFLGKTAYLLFLAPAAVDPLLQMTESFFWAPAVYLLAFLTPELRVGRASAVLFGVSLLALSLLYVLMHLGGPDWSVLYFLAQFNLANLTMLVLTQNFTLFKEHFTEVRSRGETMARLAYTDALTGLPNRLRLAEVMQQTIERAKARRETFAVIFIDLDRFKSVNDTLGHEAGDLLLKAVAERLTSQVREHDLLARISGDEFVLLVDGVGGAAEVEEVARRLMTAFGAPFRLAGGALNITASLGFCLYPGDGESVGKLLRHADSAMYRVKAGGRSGVRRFSAQADARLELERQLERDLRGAAGRGELLLHYQPLYDLRGGGLVKLEALLRWQHPALGPVSPATFIPLAERTGVIGELGAWALGTACAQNAAWQRAGYAEVAVAVNVSPLQFAQPGFYEEVERALKRSGLSPRHLELELTESTVLHDAAHVSALLGRLRRLGVRAAIDDFGTGYSSLSYLQHLPIGSVKVDRAFIADLGAEGATPPFALALVQAILTVAQTLGLEVVAEGIETEAQAALLKELGCQLGQGFLFARPLPAEEVRLALRRAGEAARPELGAVN